MDDLMSDIQEQMEVANEIGDAISNQMGFGQDVDEVSSARFCELIRLTDPCLGIKQCIWVFYLSVVE